MTTKRNTKISAHINSKIIDSQPFTYVPTFGLSVRTFVRSCTYIYTSVPTFGLSVRTFVRSFTYIYTYVPTFGLSTLIYLHL